MSINILDFLLSNEAFLKDFITRSTYHSNAIEGNTLSYAETYALIYNDNSFKIEGKEPREIYEAINHKKALTILFEALKANDNLNDRLIKKLNETINQDIKNTEGYRKIQVFVNGSSHIPPAPEKIPNLMNYFVYNYNNSTEEIFEKIAKYHIEFEKIHPFEDGNGRTGRLLINYELIKNNISPIVIPKEDRTKYFDFLQNQDIIGLANWFKELSLNENERIHIFM